MRVLLDTNVLARAPSGPSGPASQLLLEVTHPEHVLLLSPFLVDELGRVLRYDRLRAIHGLNDHDIDRYVANLLLVGHVVFPASADAVVPDDPEDDPIVAAAVAG